MNIPTPISRRRFLGGVACTLAAAGLPGCAAAPVQRGVLRDDRLVLDLAETQAQMAGRPAILVEAAGAPVQFILIRQGDAWRALSALCTHQNCQVRPQRHLLVCPCHGSTFDFDGQVTRGPAPKALPAYRVEVGRDTLEIWL